MLRFIQRVLSLLFPIKSKNDIVYKNIDCNWSTLKRKELENYYCGQDGTTWRFERENNHDV